MWQYILWTVCIVIFTVTESLSFHLVTIWFALGAVGALIAAALGAGFAVQLVIFVAIAALLLVLTRPLVKKWLQPKEVHTNADRVLGKTGMVTQDITPEKFAGKVTVAGQEWSAVSTDGGCIYAGETVEVVRMEGVKLLVRRIGQEG